MTKAFCPGHITCFFRPAGESGSDQLHRGSIGAGIRTSLGSTVEVVERSAPGLRITMDGQLVDAPVTEAVFAQLSPDRGYEVTILNDLPCGEGFGMSAAGAVASAFCLADMLGLSEQKAYEAAHIAEIVGGGGLGDVSAISCLAHQPVRVSPGLPPNGEVIGTGISFEKLTLAVLGPKVHTGNLLGNEFSYNAIVAAGGMAVDDFMSRPTEDSLYSISNVFSRNAGVECPTVSEALETIHAKGHRAGMCMLGNSIFSDVPYDEAERFFGEGVQVFTCSSTDAAPTIIRKG